MMKTLIIPKGTRAGVAEFKRTMKHTQKQLLNEALEENGIICFHKVDQPLVTDLCDIIGILYCELQAKGMTEAQIEKMFER